MSQSQLPSLSLSQSLSIPTPAEHNGHYDSEEQCNSREHFLHLHQLQLLVSSFSSSFSRIAAFALQLCAVASPRPASARAQHGPLGTELQHN